MAQRDYAALMGPVAAKKEPKKSYLRVFIGFFI